MKRSQASLFALAALFAATSSLAQPSEALVNVDLGTVATTIAQNLKVDVAKIPASLQVPVGIAAGACGVPANQLASAAGSDKASCQATGTTAALDQVVRKQVGEQK